MRSFNKVMLYGNLTADPEAIATKTGKSMVTFRIAANNGWKNKDGEKQESVEFHNIVAFGKQADLIGQYMKKGRPIMIEGRLKLDTWEDKQTNQKRSKLGVVMESFQFLDFGGRGAEEGAPSAPRPKPSPAPAAAAPEAAEEPPPEDDVPF